MIRLGYEISDDPRRAGRAVEIPLRHTAVTGQTQESGKTTTLEALIDRSGLRAVAFVTKPGEKSFRLQTPIAPYFREPALTAESPMWRWIELIFVSIGESLPGDEQALVMQCSEYVLAIERYKQKGELKTRVAETRVRVEKLEQVAANVALMLSHARGRDKKSLTRLNAYFKIVLPQIRKMKATGSLALGPGLNVMDLEGLSNEMQMLVVRSVLETVSREGRNTVVIVPEAWKFIPLRRATPVRLAAERFIRQGLVLNNVLMIDSQDLAGIATEILKSIGVWILGKQSEINEVRRVVDYIPAIPKIAREAIMQLGKGQFYVVSEGTVRKCYVQPAGMTDEHARAIALGEESADSWRQIARQLDKEQFRELVSRPNTDQNDGLISSHEMGPDSDQPFGRNIEPLPAYREPHQQVQILDQESPNDEPSTDTSERAASDSPRDRDAEPAGCADADRSNLPPGAAPPAGETDSEAPEPESEDAMRFSLVDVDEALDHLLRVHLRRKNPIAFPCNDCPEFVKRQDVVSDALPTGAETPAAVIAGRESLDPAAQGLLAKPAEIPVSNGSYESLKKNLLADPAILAALDAARPEIALRIARPVLEMDMKGDRGRLALLIHQKYFSKPRPIPEVVEEFRRRGWMESTGRPRPLNVRLGELASMGFLTIEAEGYLAVPGMKITTKEV